MEELLDDALLFHMGRSESSKKPKKKAATPPPESWFESLQLGQLAELCAASKIPTSGTKAELISRLESSSAAEFSVTGRASRVIVSRASESVHIGGGRPGHTLASLKQACTAAGLRSTGDRYELVLLLLKHRSGLDTGPAPKKPRLVGPDGAALPAKPRAIKDMDKLSERALAWCTPDKSKWSNQRWKYHGGDVLKKALKVMTTNAGAGAAHGLDVARALFSGLGHGASSVTGWGYSTASYDATLLADEVMKHFSAAVPLGLLPVEQV